MSWSRWPPSTALPRVGQAFGGGSPLCVRDPACSDARARSADACVRERRRSYVGRSLSICGRSSKLWGGGGELVYHSSAFPPHGSLPATRPYLAERKMLIAVTATPIPRISEPIVATSLNSVKL